MEVYERQVLRPDSDITGSEEEVRVIKVYFKEMSALATKRGGS